jgi:hypothetical protein
LHPLAIKIPVVASVVPSAAQVSPSQSPARTPLPVATPGAPSTTFIAAASTANTNTTTTPSTTSTTTALSSPAHERRHLRTVPFASFAQRTHIPYTWFDVLNAHLAPRATSQGLVQALTDGFKIPCLLGRRIVVLAYTVI